MVEVTVGNVDNVRDVVGQWKEGAWLAVPYPITIYVPGIAVVGNATFTSEWVCPFEEAYFAAISISNSAAGVAGSTLSVRNAATELIDADGNGTGAVVITDAVLTTPLEFSRNAGTLLEYAMTRGDELIIALTGDADSTTHGLLVVITMMVPIQALDETTTPGKNFKFV